MSNTKAMNYLSIGVCRECGCVVDTSVADECPACGEGFEDAE